MMAWLLLYVFFVFGIVSQIIPVHIEKVEFEEFYNGCCNGMFWPLFHSMPDRANFVSKDWKVRRRTHTSTRAPYYTRFASRRRTAKSTRSSPIARWTPWGTWSNYWTRRATTRRPRWCGFTTISCWRLQRKSERCARTRTSVANSASSCTYRSRRGTSWDCCRGTTKCFRECWVNTERVNIRYKHVHMHRH